ncbi:MAG: hypothetical protein V4805_06490 [Pseudomonadota bacterium]
MSRDRRGFDYALEPMRSVTEWEMNDVGRALAGQNAAAAIQENTVNQLLHSFAAARSDVLLQRQMHPVLNIDAQRVAHAYMVQVQQQLVSENAQLHILQQERDETFATLNSLRKFADNLDRNKEMAAKEYDQQIVKQVYQQSDDSWLQRLHWRENS